MIKKIFSSQSKSITGAAIVLGAASFVSRIIGVLRDRLFAHQFGAGIELDMYYAAFRIPDLVYHLLIAGALSAGFIPVFLEVYKKNKQDAWDLTNNVLHILILSILIICSLLFLLMPQLISLVVPGFEATAMQETVRLSRIMLLSPIIFGVSALISGVLQARKMFFIYSLTPIFYNVGIILSAVVLVPLFGIDALAYGVIIGALLHLLIQLPAIFSSGYRYTPLLQLRQSHVHEVFRLMIPRMITLGIHNINLIITTIFASTLIAGSITVYTFANNLQFFAVGIIGISYALAAFPTLCQAINEKNEKLFAREFSRTVRQILFFVIPLTVIFLFLRAQIVRVVLGSGLFDWSATITTANTLSWFAISLFAQCLIPLYTRGFYAKKNTRTPLFIAGVTAVVNIIASFYLKDLFGVVGLAMAFSLSAFVQFIFLWLMLRSSLQETKRIQLIRAIASMTAAGVAMAATIQSLKLPLSTLVDMNSFIGISTQGALAATAGLIVYIAFVSLLKVEECTLLVNSLNRRWLHIRSVIGLTPEDEI